jgi:outer membrane lipoprotein-sorting protein
LLQIVKDKFYLAENLEIKEMRRKFIMSVFLLCLCSLASCAEPNQGGDSNSIDKILNDLHKSASNLKSYQCKVEYLFSQPVLESKTLRTGTLNYARFDKASKLKIEFNTLTQEDGPQQKYTEIYIFDGQWLTHIDYQIKQVQKRQLAEANETLDAFELASRNFPIIGFSKTEDLRKQFKVTLISDSNNQIHLNLKVKSDSDYKNDYKTVDVWINKQLMLPEKLKAESTQGDIYEIKFINSKANENIDAKVFDFKIPEGFGEPEIIPLKTK